MRWILMVMAALCLCLPYSHDAQSKYNDSSKSSFSKKKSKKKRSIAASSKSKKKKRIASSKSYKKSKKKKRRSRKSLKQLKADAAKYKKINNAPPIPWSRHVALDKNKKPLKLKTLNPYAFRLLSLKQRHIYLKNLRKTYLTVIADYQKQEKRYRKRKRGKNAQLDASELKLKKIFDRLVAMSSIIEPAHANDYEWRQVGRTCFYAGYASQYVQVGNRVTCARPTNGDGTTNFRNSWNGQQYCANGQILCNPLIFGLGNNGNGTQTEDGKRKGYCVSPGRNAFDNCQQLYYNDSGYPASAISDFLLDQSRNPQAVNQFIELQEQLREFCEGIDSTPSGRFTTAKRNCSQFNRRTAKLIEKARAAGGDLTARTTGTEEAPVAGANAEDREPEPEPEPTATPEEESDLVDTEIAPDAGTETADDAEVVSEPGTERAAEEFKASDSCQDSILKGMVDDPRALRNGVSGDFACAACLAEHVQRANGGRFSDRRVSPSMMILLSIVAKNCPMTAGGDLPRGPSATRVFQLVERFGSCPIDILPRPEEGQWDDLLGRDMDRTTELLNLTNGASDIFTDEPLPYRGRTQETYRNAFYREYGILPSDMKEVFCPGGQLRENPGEISEAINNVSREMNRNRILRAGSPISEYVPTRSLMRQRRGQLARCMAHAQEQKQEPNSCRVVEESTLNVEGLSAAGMRDQEKNLPTFVSIPATRPGSEAGAFEGSCYTLLEQTQQEDGSRTMFGLNQYGEAITATLIDGGTRTDTESNQRNCGQSNENGCVVIQPPASGAFCSLPANATRRTVIDENGIEINCEAVRQNSRYNCQDYSADIPEGERGCNTLKAMLPGRNLTYHRLSCEGPKFELAPATRLNNTPTVDRPQET